MKRQRTLSLLAVVLSLNLFGFVAMATDASDTDIKALLPIMAGVFIVAAPIASGLLLWIDQRQK